MLRRAKTLSLSSQSSGCRLRCAPRVPAGAAASRPGIVVRVQATDTKRVAPAAAAAGRGQPAVPGAEATHGPTAAGPAAAAPSWLHSPWDSEILALAVPAALALAADPLLGMVDTALVGRLGADELAALGINTALFSLSFVVFNFLATATTPMVASAVSGNNSRAAGETVWQASLLAVVLGCAVSVGLASNATLCLEVMGADSSQQHVQDMALQYLKTRAYAAPAVLLVTVGQGVFRGIANMRAPLLITLATNTLHLGLDVLLMFELGLGIKGAAISTAASEWLAAAAYGTLIWQRKEQLGLWPPPQLALSELRQRCMPFMQAGSAVLMRTGSLLGTKTLATAVAARLGPSSVASHQVLMQLWVLASMLVDSLAVSGQTLIAVQMGRGQRRTARQISERLLALGLGLGCSLSVVLAASSPLWPQLFTDDEGVLGQIRQLVPLAVLPLPVNALVYTLDGVLVGASDFGYLMTAMVGASALAASMLMMVEPSGSGLQGVWTALAVLMVGRLATLSWRFQSPDGPVPPNSSNSSLHEPEQQQADAVAEQQQQLALLQQVLDAAQPSQQTQSEQQQQQHGRDTACGGGGGDAAGDAAAAGSSGAAVLLSNSLPGNSKLQAHRKQVKQQPTAAQHQYNTNNNNSKPYKKVHNGFRGPSEGSVAESVYNSGTAAEDAADV